MVTVTFQIKPYLAAYMYMRYKNHLDVPPDRSSSSLSAIHLLDTQPIYHFLHQLSIPHPPNASWHETGNITFTLPHPRNGKNPNVYNYIGHNSALIIEKAMEVEMRAELYEFLLENKYCHGIMFKKSMETFVEHYNMVGLVEEESLMRAFQRWRKMMKEEKNRWFFYRVSHKMRHLLCSYWKCFNNWIHKRNTIPQWVYLIINIHTILRFYSKNIFSQSRKPKSHFIMILNIVSYIRYG